MRLKRFATAGTILILTLTVSCSKENTGEKKAPAQARQIVKIEKGFYGWDSITLRSAYSRLDIIPELGGKIMGYDLRGFQVLWHDPKREGELYKNEGYGFGESFFNPGGAKVWPAPQGWSGPGEWPGPPDNVLDGSPYEVMQQGNSVTVTSPSDTGEGRSGLQFSHTYSLAQSASIVALKLSMKNVVDRSVKWGLWHLATVPVDRKMTVYVPVNQNDWHVIFGDKNNPQWLGVENGLFRAQYDKRVGKVGMKAREGWAAWHDEENNIVYAMLFPVQKGAEYPDSGSNFEIWTSGAGTYTANNREFQTEYAPETAMMELEVMGPLSGLRPGESSSLDVTWGVCRCSGVKHVTPYGVVAQEPVIEGNTVRAKFGVFYGGYLMIEYIDKNGNRKGIKNSMEISPISEVIIDQDIEDIASFAAGVRYHIQPFGTETLGTLGQVMFKK